jgi:hypothetical protein
VMQNLYRLGSQRHHRVQRKEASRRLRFPFLAIFPSMCDARATVTVTFCHTFV